MHIKCLHILQLYTCTMTYEICSMLSKPIVSAYLPHREEVIELLLIDSLKVYCPVQSAGNNHQSKIHSVTDLYVSVHTLE